jgi:hypothetical protein
VARRKTFSPVPTGEFHRSEGVETVVRIVCPALFFALVLSATPVAAQSPPALSYFERLTLANWKHAMRVDRSTKHWTPTGMLLVAARPTEVMATFMDFGRYSTFMPKVQSCKVVRKRGPNEIWALVVTNLPWPVANAWVAVKYNWKRAGAEGYYLEWERHRGSMAKYWGRLALYPWGKHHTLAICTMQAVPDAVVPRGKLNDGIVWATEQLLHHVRAEVDRRRKHRTLRPFAP